jgi:hypothetical protein
MVGKDCNKVISLVQKRQEIGKQKLLGILMWHILTAKMYPETADIYSRSW